MSLAGRSNGLEAWVRCAAFRSFLALDLGKVVFRGPDEESLEVASLSSWISHLAMCRGTISSEDWLNAVAFRLAREASMSARSSAGLFEAMQLTVIGNLG